MMVIAILAFLVGLESFPVLFYFQKLFRLPVPDLKKGHFHIHHSTYGVLLILIGVIALSKSSRLSVVAISMGLGFIVHHEVSEPGLKGVGRFIYINPRAKKGYGG